MDQEQIDLKQVVNRNKQRLYWKNKINKWTEPVLLLLFKSHSKVFNIQKKLWNFLPKKDISFNIKTYKHIKGK